MTDFERSLATALRDAAEEISMTTDQQRAAEELRTRLDESDRRRRRRTWAVAIAAAAAVALAVVGVRALMPAAPVDTRPLAPSVSPTPAPTPSPTPSPTRYAAAFTSRGFEVPFTATVPDWVAEFMPGPISSAARHVTWNRCPGGDECIGLSVSRFTAVPVDTTSSTTRPIASYDAYVKHLTSLGKKPGVTVTAKKATTVDGRPATVFSFTTTEDLPDMLGCETAVIGGDNCWTLAAGVPTRVAAIDTGGVPVVVLTRTPDGNPDRDAWLGQFDGFLSSIRFR
jgi:hypothetical protein